MTKKDFFRVIIKLMGLYFIISIVFSTLPSNIIFGLQSIPDVDIVSILWIVGVTVITIGIFVFLLYKTDKLIQWLKLDKGFDEDRIIFQNFSTQNILKLAIVIIGGLLVINNIPIFLSYLFFAFKSEFGSDYNSHFYKFGSMNDYVKLITSFLSIIIGYLLLRYFNRISRLLNSKENNLKS